MEDGEQLLVLSARSARSLTLLAHAWADYLDGDGHRHRLRDLCAAAALRRDTHPHRLWARGATPPSSPTACAKSPPEIPPPAPPPPTPATTPAAPPSSSPARAPNGSAWDAAS
ncbi:hypothetical protein ACFQ0M_49430 [Kitasatospora aburaviensis]